MKKPTQKQVDEEIATLKQMLPNVIERSMFGDNHRDAIDAQIQVLQDRMSNDDIYDREADAEDEDEDGIEDDSSWKENMIEAALDALRWMDGEEKTPPHENWKDLLIK